MSRYKAYSEYKESGIAWLGKIPSHWLVSKVKHVAAFQVGWTPPTKDDENFEGDNLWANISDLRGREISETSKMVSDSAVKAASMQITPKGSLLYSFKLSVGAVSFAGKDMYTNEAIASFLKESELPLAYLYYVLPKYLIENASTNIYGARILNQELICNANLIVPTFDEATNIANFLDHETAKIDALIDKQQRLIELLKEKRQAVISHAVTKGLNPNAPMKDSGVEWLGEVPAHWVVTRAKFVATVFVPQRNKPDLNNEEGIAWATMEDMKGVAIESTKSYVNVEAAKVAGSKTLKAGAVIASCVGSFGVASINKVDVIINQQLQAYIPRSINDEYLRNTVLISKNYFELIGTAATIAYVNQEGFENLPVLIPPIEEQYEISRHIEKKLFEFEKLISKGDGAIQLIQERRTALISAAVTGKIDVRD